MTDRDQKHPGWGEASAPRALWIINSMAREAVAAVTATHDPKCRIDHGAGRWWFLKRDASGAMTVRDALIAQYGFMDETGSWGATISRYPGGDVVCAHATVSHEDAPALWVLRNPDMGDLLDVIDREPGCVVVGVELESVIFAIVSGPYPGGARAGPIGVEWRPYDQEEA